MQSIFEKQLEKILKQYPDIFPTEASFWSYLRSAFRQGLWNKSRMKLEFKSRTAGPPPAEYTGRGRKGHVCALSGEWVPVSKSEIDHMKGNVSLLCENDIIPFIVHMLATSDELCVVSKEAHRVKSYSEKMGISFELALAEKQAISLIKEKKDVAWLKERGIVPLTSQAKRRKQIVEFLTKENLK